MNSRERSHRGRSIADLRSPKAASTVSTSRLRRQPAPDEGDALATTDEPNIFLRARRSTSERPRRAFYGRRIATPDSDPILEDAPIMRAHRKMKYEIEKSRRLFRPAVDCKVEHPEPVSAPERLLSLLSRQVFLFDM